MEVYKDAKIYGPYESKKDHRMRINVNGRLISYPKYLIEKYLGRYLNDNETVDHIDGNPLNNELSNLRVLDRREHCKNDAYRNKNVKVKCTMCGKEFEIDGSKLYCRNRKDRNQSGYFCSKQCSGKYGALVRSNKIDKAIVEKIKAEKYKLHKNGDMME